jgi:hypothetical protein
VEGRRRLPRCGDALSPPRRAAAAPPRLSRAPPSPCANVRSDESASWGVHRAPLREPPEPPEERQRKRWCRVAERSPVGAQCGVDRDAYRRNRASSSLRFLSSSSLHRSISASISAASATRSLCPRPHPPISRNRATHQLPFRETPRYGYAAVQGRRKPPTPHARVKPSSLTNARTSRVSRPDGSPPRLAAARRTPRGSHAASPPAAPLPPSCSPALRLLSRRRPRPLQDCGGGAVGSSTTPRCVCGRASRHWVQQ